MAQKELRKNVGWTDINRRTVLKLTGAGLIGGIGLTGQAVAQTENTPEPPEKPPRDEATWGSDGTDHWQLIDGPGPKPSNEIAHRPLYSIASVNGAHSPHGTHGPGPHDHVVDTPGSQEPFTAEWHVYVLQKNVGTEENPDWVLCHGDFTQPPPDGPTISKIDSLVASDDDFRLVDTEFDFTCPVRPHNPTDED